MFRVSALTIAHFEASDTYVGIITRVHMYQPMFIHHVLNSHNTICLVYLLLNLLRVLIELSTVEYKAGTFSVIQLRANKAFYAIRPTRVQRDKTHSLCSWGLSLSGFQSPRSLTISLSLLQSLNQVSLFSPDNGIIN